MGKGESDEISNLCASILLHFNCMSCGHCCPHRPPPPSYRVEPLCKLPTKVFPLPPTHTRNQRIFRLSKKKICVFLSLFSASFLFFSWLRFRFLLLVSHAINFARYDCGYPRCIQYATDPRTTPPPPPPFSPFSLLPSPASSTPE